MIKVNGYWHEEFPGEKLEFVNQSAGSDEDLQVEDYSPEEKKKIIIDAE
jgi:hypothetical protein